MSVLETRKAVLLRQVEGTQEQPVLMHPNMGVFYREQVAKLREALTDEGHR